MRPPVAAWGGLRSCGDGGLRSQPLTGVVIRAGRFSAAFGLVDLGPHRIEGESEDIGDGGDGREGGGRYTARLDLPEGLRRDMRIERNVEHRTLPPGAAQQGAEALSALDLCECEGQPDHGFNYTGII